MSSPDDDDETRPVSVAELLARNGTIGARPVSVNRRRKGKSSRVTVAELTGEIPVFRTGEIPVASEDESMSEDDYEEADYEEADYEEADSEGADHGDADHPPTVVVYTGESDSESYVETYVESSGVTYAEAVAETEDHPEPVIYGEVSYPEAAYPEVIYGEVSYPEGDFAEVTYGEVIYPESVAAETAEVGEAVDEIAEESLTDGESPDEDLVESPTAVEEFPAEALPVARLAKAPMPKSSEPLPRRSSGPERSHDPRPKRRTDEQTDATGAEQMNFDPVDGSINLAELVGEEGEAADLRSYLRSTGGTLFSGETVADDLARLSAEPRLVLADEPSVNPAAKGKGGKAGKDRSPAKAKTAAPAKDKDKDKNNGQGPGESRLTSLRHAAVAVLQSVLAVAFGAGLFIAFDQLWRWNNIVALVLSVLVILGLVIAVRVVRKTEDIASTLIAVAVGALVTLGPLALLQST